jgi:hypothetical protein
MIVGTRKKGSPLEYLQFLQRNWGCRHDNFEKLRCFQRRLSIRDCRHPKKSESKILQNLGCCQEKLSPVTILNKK